MNSAPVLPVWISLLILLAAEVTLVIGIAASVAHFTKSAVWRRALWHSCIVGLMVLTFIELSGAGREMAAWLALKARHSSTMPNRFSSSEQNRRPGPTPSVQVTGEFRDRVAERVAQNRKSSPAAEPRNNVASAPIEPEEAGPSPVTQRIPGRASPRWYDSGADALGILWLGLAWAVGASLVLIRAGLARVLFCIFRRQRRVVSDVSLTGRLQGLALELGFKRRVLLVESGRLTAPVAFGVLRPTIGLPGD